MKLSHYWSLLHEPQVHNLIMDLTTKSFQNLLPNLLVFERVAHYLNFSKAANELNITPTAISKSIKLLEDQVEMRLLNRSTRSVSLTEAGSELIEVLKPLLSQVKTAIDRLSESERRPKGEIRITASQIAYSILIEPYLKKFIDKYPDITFDISFDNKLVDITAEGFDLGIRLGESLQKDMIAFPVRSIQRAVAVASPKYLNTHGVPSQPRDLLKHNCIRQRFFQEVLFLNGNLR